MLIKLGLPMSFFLFPFPFQADSLEHRGPLRSLSCLGFYDPLEKVPKVGHLQLFERVPAAYVNRVSPVLGLYWLSA